MRPRLVSTSTTARALHSHMLQFLSTIIHSHRSHIKQVRSLFYHFSTLPTTTSTSFTDPSSPSSSKLQNNDTRLDLSSIKFNGFAQSVILNCSHFLDKKKGKDFANASVKDLILYISDIVPNTARRLIRISVLKPEDVLGILLGFQSENGKVRIGARKVETLWEIFKRANEQDKGFKHLPRSCEVMASLLIHAGMLREVEFLLSTIESQGISLDGLDIFCNLIQGYAGDGELERAIVVYEQMRGRGFMPSVACCRVLLDILVQKKKIQLANRVCWDMLEMNANLSDPEKASFENVIRLLCRNGHIQEGRNLANKALVSGLEPSSSVINEIARGYCEKKDFEDLLSFFARMKCAPTVIAGNKIMHCLCLNFGTERAGLFLQELKALCFNPDEITFSILIGWSCHEGKLKKAFFYLSDMLSKCLKPHICSYNALISGLFKEGMWKHAQDIIHEMVDRGTPPDISTFRILLAGFCKARQFDEVKRTVCQMARHGFIQLSSLEDPLSKAFRVLGLDPLAVRLKRDNNIRFSKTEFLDNLGNGLYLDTDLDEYEKTVTRVLEDSIIPNFNTLIMEQCGHRNFTTALLLVNEMVHWGQELSLSVFSALVEGFCSSRSHIKAVVKLLEKMPELADQLDQETLNLVVRAYCKKGLINSGKIVLDRMLQRHLIAKNETYTALIMGSCKKGSLKDLHCCWEVAQRNKWLPGLNDCKALVGCLCQREMLEEALHLLEHMLVYNIPAGLDIFSVLLENLCASGFTRIAHVLLDGLLKQGFILDRMAYSHVVRGFCKEKEFSAAFMMLDNMLAKNLVPCLDVSVLLIPLLCRVGRFEKAIALKEIALRDQILDSSSLHGALVKGFCMTGNVREVATVFQDILFKGILPAVELYDMLVQGHCQVKNLRKVWELLGGFIRKNLSLSISSYRNLVRLMLLEGRVPHALNLTALMLGQSKSNDLIIYNILIFYLFATGNSSLVKNILDQLQEKELLHNEVTYNFLIYGFSQCKDVSSTAHCLSTMISKELRPSNRSLRTVISSLCGAGELGKALYLSQEMELRGWVHDSIIQNAIVEGLISLGNLHEAEDLLDRMVEKCLIPDNINYDNLIKRFCLHNRLNKAVDLLNIMLKKGTVPNSSSYDSVIQGFCTQNRLDEAMDFYTEMLYRDLKPSIKTSGMFVHALCQNGRTEEAENLLISILQVGESTREMYCAIVNRYRLENNLKKASELMHVMQQRGYDPDFETHWSLISNLSNSSDKDDCKNNQGFLSSLLSVSGFAGKRGSKAELG
ncbi:pentatricopeptide repeat-containing protein At5g15280, mitochondrial [Carya illinoinensis]|uniref:Pentatricopeptide repeat-containing protein n=1 Tax=Carya illinoinensis TaxID=32201 RepID=A0A8T1QPM7_CARIL|nr:pentatricopeptide repeat-containing protein At5g15280, mitochondrial [Carya illinoinensis]KAG6656189.1 hypothetical protein CIPAW_04G004700 [Carya illinoinensis]